MVYIELFWDIYFYLKLFPFQVSPRAVILTENPSVSGISYYGSCSNCAVTSSNAADFANDTSATAAASDGVGVLEAAAADFEH